MPRWLQAVNVLVVTAAAAALVYINAGRDRTDEPGDSSPAASSERSPAGAQRRERARDRMETAVKLVSEFERGRYGLTTTGELRHRVERGGPHLLVDTRGYETGYLEGHIPGALSFPFPRTPMADWDAGLMNGESADDFAAFLGTDRDRQVIFYCKHVRCASSHNAASWAVRLGFRNVRRYAAGIRGWRMERLPTAN